MGTGAAAALDAHYSGRLMAKGLRCHINRGSAKDQGVQRRIAVLETLGIGVTSRSLCRDRFRGILEERWESFCSGRNSTNPR